MRGGSIFFLLVLFWGCSKVSESSTKIIGHGGTGLHIQSAIYHDNSLEAIQYALSLPHCYGVEVDVRMDSEGKLWLFHDEQLNQGTNMDGTIESSSTSALTTAHYQTLKKEALVRLNEETKAVLSEGFCFLDLKAVANTSWDLFRSALLSLQLDTTKTALIVNNWQAFEALKDDFSLYFSVSDWDQMNLSWLENQPRLQGICLRNEEITREEVNFLKSINKKVIVYEMRSPTGIKKALRKNPDYVLTDDLKLTIGMVYP